MSPSEKSLNWKNIITVISVMILIGSEVLVVALAAGWAIAGLLQLGDTISYIMMGIFVAGGLYAMGALWKKAVLVDPVRT